MANTTYAIRPPSPTHTHTHTHMIQHKVCYLPDLHLLQASHLHVDLLGGLVVTCPQCVEGDVAVLSGLVVAAQRLLELAPQLLHGPLQLHAKGVLLLNVLQEDTHTHTHRLLAQL